MQREMSFNIKYEYVLVLNSDQFLCYNADINVSQPEMCLAEQTNRKWDAEYKKNISLTKGAHGTNSPVHNYRSSQK